MKKYYLIGGIFLLLIGCPLGGWYRAHCFMQAVEQAAQCANEQILSDREEIALLYEKQRDNQVLTPSEQVFLKKLALKYHKKVSASLLSELYQEVIPLPVSVYKAQAALITHHGWGRHIYPFGTYAWNQGRYQKQPVTDLCVGALAFAYDFQTLPAFRVLRRAMIPLIEKGYPVHAEQLLILMLTRNAAEEAYRTKLMTLVKEMK